MGFVMGKEKIARKILAAACAAVLLCGCGNTVLTQGNVSEFPAYEETVPTVTTVSEAEAASETTVPPEPVTEMTTVTEILPPAEITPMNFPPEFYTALDGVMQKYPHFGYYDISLAYTDFETGFTLMLNPDKHYFSASVMKAPYMLYIYRLALAGEADLEQKLTYTEKYRKEGTGVLKDMEFGTEFTVEELIGFALEESDNAAFAMLRELYPEDGYTDFVKSLGVEHDSDSRAFNHPQICCETALILSRAVYDFICEENEYSETLKYHMTHSRNTMIVGNSGSEVVRKYGWYDGYFHDMAVVLGEKNYALTIMTNLDLLVIDSREYGIFRDLSALIAEYSTQLAEDENSGNPVIINSERQEVYEMALPKDPYMLLSVLNMKLRDIYSDLDALCDDMEASPAEISEAMGKLGYEYSKEENQFVPTPEDEKDPTDETDPPEE